MDQSAERASGKCSPGARGKRLLTSRRSLSRLMSKTLYYRPTPKMDHQNDASEGERLRDQGMAWAALGSEEYMRIIQPLLINLAKRKGIVSADDAREIEISLGLSPEKENARGSLFKGRPHWEFVHHGRSKRKVRHAGIMAFWRYRNPTN